MSTPTRRRWWKSPRMLLRTILQLDDTPHAIALGTAIGMWIGMTPTVGIQMGLVMLVAFLTRPLFRFNVMAAIVTVYISNPITMIPIYWFNYEVGSLFIEGMVTRDQFSGVMKSEKIQDSWTAALTLVYDLGWPLVIGSLVVATVCSVITYPSMLGLVYRFRRSNPEHPAIDGDAASATPDVPKAEIPEHKTGGNDKMACVADDRRVTVESIVMLTKSATGKP